MTDKDLSDDWRAYVVVDMAKGMARSLSHGKQSLGLAREAWIAAFDEEAAKLEAEDATE